MLVTVASLILCLLIDGILVVITVTTLYCLILAIKLNLFLKSFPH